MNARAYHITAGTLAMSLAMLPSCGPGERHEPTSRTLIIGGEPVPNGEMTGVVGLALPKIQDPQQYELVCTGTLIAPTVIVTAGHCLENESSRLARLRIYVGNGLEGGLVEAQATVLRLERHPLLRRYPLGYADYGLVELTAPLADAEPIAPLRDFADQHPLVQPSKTVTLVGFGRRGADGIGVKYRVAATVKSVGTREALVGGDGRDACAGDSGGPALVRDSHGALRLAGVISRASGVGCGNGGYVGLVADVACWIAAATGNADDSCSEAPDYPDDEVLSFRTLCDSKTKTPTQAKTIAALMVATSTHSCAGADQALASLTELDLAGYHLRDLTPLASLNQLTALDLRGNFITQLQPLTHLTNLRTLRIDGNDATDLDMLAAREAAGLIVFGKRAQLSNYFATDFLALCNGTDTSEATRKTIRAVLWTTMADDCEKANERLLSIRSLRFGDRELTDLSPLAGLTGLESLDVSNNPLSSVAPLATVENLRTLNLSGAAAVDLAPLGSLVARGLNIQGR